MRWLMDTVLLDLQDTEATKFHRTSSPMSWEFACSTGALLLPTALERHCQEEPKQGGDTVTKPSMALQGNTGRGQ